MSFWKATKLLLTLHCEESTQLMSAAMERELSAVERWAVRCHVFVCVQCRRFQRQLRFLQQVGQQRDQASPPPTLPSHVRDEILRQLQPPSDGES